MLRKILIVLEMIKFEHTLFALPFAFLGAVLGARGLPDWKTGFWILLAMIGARSAAMAFNRLADRKLDSRNPRTQSRALPSGQVSPSFVVVFVAASCALFLWAAWNLNPLALALAPPALLVVLFYSLTKRFTFLSHLFLGLALAIAPVGGWVAVRGTLDWQPFLIALAVVFWVAGFDILYACQDIDFDRRSGLHSIPQRYGIRGALLSARLLHTCMFLLLIASFLVFRLSWLSWAGLALVGTSLVYEHSLVSATDLSRVNVAFFTINGVISIALLLFVGFDLALLL